MKPSLVVPALFVAFASAASASAQATTRLTLSGFNGQMNNNTVADYDQGFKTSATATTYTVANITLATSRTTTVTIQANAATMGGGKPVGDCSWRRNDLGTWNPLTTSPVVVESRVIAGVGTTWNNLVFFRCLLDWATDPPFAYAVVLTFTLQVTP